MKRPHHGKTAAALLILAACTARPGEPGVFVPGGPATPDTPGGDPPPSNPPPAPPAPRPFVPGVPVMRRLLAAEYRASILDLLGAAAADAAEAPLDSSVNGFDAIGASQLALSDADVLRYESSARAAAAIAAESGAIARYLSCEPLTVDAADCMRELVERFGLRAFRRPLVEEEILQWLAIGREAARTLASFERGAQWVVTGMLQAPSFLYRVEVGEPDPADPTRRILGPWELASRLSYFLVGSTPDEVLLASAQSGELSGERALRQHAQRLLLADGGVRAKKALSAFYDEILRLRELDSVMKNREIYPEFDRALAAAMREETLLLIEDLAWNRDSDFRELLDAQYTFVNARLATHYGLPEPRQEGFVRVELPQSGLRSGILGHGSFLSLMSHGVLTSPTLRGKFVRETLLCQAIPLPEGNVNMTFPSDPPQAPKTMRERLQQHRADPNCAVCHALTDGVGLALENFDAIGRWRADENGRPIDASGNLDGERFDGPRDLARLLRGKERATRCIVRNLYRHATGHLEDTGEEPEIEAIAERFADSGHRMQALLVEIVASKAFRLVKPR